MDGLYANLEELANKIVTDAKNKSLVIFANNSIGKTTLSRQIGDLKDTSEFLCFNTFVEEVFEWDNDFENDCFDLRINQNDTFINDAIITQGLDRRITEIFQSFINIKIDPDFIIENNLVQKIVFSLATGDEAKIDNIKLSKGEESIFVWSVFCAIVEMALDEKLSGNPDYQNLNYIVIDDPITSLSEENIISVALEIKNFIIDKISEIREKSCDPIGVLIATHNRLFFNIFFSEVKSKCCYRLYRNEDGFLLSRQNESPFGYHIEEMRLLKSILDNNEEIEKIHFNMFRNILEKTAAFFGYSKWSDCLDMYIDGRGEFIKLLNFHSHNRLVDLDDKKIQSTREKELFKTFFEQFLEDYKWDKDTVSSRD